MELRIFTEPQQGATYDELLPSRQAAEDLGFGAFFRSDHYLGDGRRRACPGPTDAWVTLAGLARETSTIRLGTLVTSATFRHPGPLAIEVAQVDQMSGGRVELGIGAGLVRAEHAAYGIPFPATGERFDRLEEQLAIITGLWATPDGETLLLRRASTTRSPTHPALPKPVQRPRPPIIIGGNGQAATPALAARYADEFNLPFVALEVTATQFDRVRAACEDDRPRPRRPRYSNALVLCCGADEAEVRRRAEAIGQDPDDLRANGLAGTPAEVVDRIGRFAELGAQRIYLQTLDLRRPRPPRAGRRARSCPRSEPGQLGERAALGVGDLAEQHQDQVDQVPDAAAAEGDQLEDPEAGVAEVEPVHAEGAEEAGEQHRDQPLAVREQAGELLGLEPAAAGLVAQARVALELAGEGHLAQLLEAVGAVLLAEVGQHEGARDRRDGGVLLA